MKSDYHIASDIRKNKNTLIHHGIDGQRWGVKHGPPYPLGSKVSTGSSLRKGAKAKSIAKSALGGAALGAVVGGIVGGPVGAVASAVASAGASALKADLTYEKNHMSKGDKLFKRAVGANTTEKKNDSKNDKVSITGIKNLDKTHKQDLEIFMNNVKSTGQEDFARHTLDECLELFTDFKSPDMYEYGNNLKKINYIAKHNESIFNYEKSNGNSLTIYGDEMGNANRFVESKYSEKISPKLEQSLVSRIKTDDHSSYWVKNLDGGDNIEFLSRSDITAGKLDDSGKEQIYKTTTYTFSNDYGLFNVEGHYNSNNKFVIHDITVDD